MATTSTKQQTYRLFKVAAELNIGKETIVEFLKVKGFDIPVKPTSALTQEMYDLVMDKFEKEHRQIEKQRKKVDAYHERRGVKREEEPAVAVPETKRGKKKDSADETAPVAPTDEPIAVETPELEQPAPEAEAPQPAPVEAVEAPVHVVEREPEPAVVADLQEKEIAVVEQDARDYEEHSTPVATPEQTIADEPVIVHEEPSAPEIIEQPAPVAERPRVVEPEPEMPAPVAERPRAVERPRVAEPEPVAEERAAPVEAAAPAEEPEIAPDTVEDDAAPRPEFKAEQPKLQGLTVLGKIELASKAASKDKDKDAQGRRKRKRIREAVKSVDIKQEQGRSAPPASRPATSDRTVGGPTARPPQGGGGTPAQTAGGGNKKKTRGRGPGVSVDQTEVNRAIRQTFSNMGDAGGSARQKRSRAKRDIREERAMRRMEREQAEASVLAVTEFLTVAELANLMNVDVAQVIATCIGLGLMVSINQRLDKDTIQLVADEFGYSVEFQQDYAEDILADIEDPVETLTPRAPIVTIMGHVDHGKTSLLDYIRSANVVAGEAGGITQHIGAYSVQVGDGRKITFLDTPGHEAFTAMRARGAQITDIVILVVAADDSVMPQTLEAISHAQAANVPMVVAINKVDKPEANPERIKQQLSERGVLVEEWGGRYQAVEISAKKGMGIDKLLETILLEAEILDLKANAQRNARGVIIEAEIDKGKGIIATVLVQKGTLKVGDNFVAGQYAGRVRALMDERGNRIKQAGPSEPAQVLGLGGVPTAGDVVVCLDSEQDAKEIAIRRQQLRREQEFKQVRHITLDEISEQISRGGVQHLPLVIKGDVDGSVEALADSLLRLSTPEVQVSVVMKGVGEISESDVLLATASNAIIIGFHVRPNLKARKLAEREGVEIRTYQIIYDTVNEVRAALEGMLRPEQKEIITGTVEIREIFKVSKIGVIAGCYVLDGKITRNDKVRLLRDGLEVYTGSISSLKRLKDDVREVEQGFECGMTLENMNDIKQGDIIEAYKMVEVKRKLESVSSY